MIMKPQVKRKSIFFSNKRVLFYCLLFFPATNLLSQKGLSIKVSLGSGYTMESSKLNDSGFAIVSKNHAIAWGISEHFALQIGEFGGLTKQKIELKVSILKERDNCKNGHFKSQDSKINKSLND